MILKPKKTQFDFLFFKNVVLNLNLFINLLKTLLVLLLFGQLLMFFSSFKFALIIKHEPKSAAQYFDLSHVNGYFPSHVLPEV